MSYFRSTHNQDSMANKADCADVCKVLDWGMNGKKLDDLSQSVREAIVQLMGWVKTFVRVFNVRSVTRVWPSPTVRFRLNL